MPRFSFFLRLPVLLLIVHAYIVWRLASGLGTPEGRTLIVIVMVLIYLIMMAGFLARDKVGVPTYDAVSWAGFMMLGLFSWLFVLTIVRDVLGLFIALLSLFYFSDDMGIIDTYFRPYSVWIVIAFSILATLIGLFNARRRPAIVNIEIHLRNLPLSLNGFSIAQISDLHVGPTIKKGFVRRVVDDTNALDADVIVLTGDLVDGSVARLSSHTLPLASLRAPHGVYAVTGNHEYYVGAQQWVDEFRRLGIRVLMNQHQVLEHKGSTLLMAGVTDFSAEKFESSQASDPAAALQGAPSETDIKILLAHQPRSMVAAAPLGFDLQLSGHTHGGQYWPWGYFVPLQQPLVAGLHDYQGMQIYVSRGTGYWGPPLRLGAPSEITYISLRQLT